MTNDYTYKVSLVFAIALHLVLVFLLFTKFTVSKPKYGLVASGNFISATAINERDLKKLTHKKRVVQKKVVPKVTKKEKIVKIQKKKPAVKKVVSKKTVALKKAQQKKKLLAKKRGLERKKKEKLKKELIEKRELELQKALYDEIRSERNQISKELDVARSVALQGEVDKHKVAIMQAIDSNWIKPMGADDGDYCQLLINVAPGGLVLDVQLLKSNGNESLERSANAAIMKSSPLPVPSDKRLFDEMRVIKIMFKPEGVV